MSIDLRMGSRSLSVLLMAWLLLGVTLHTSEALSKLKLKKLLKLALLLPKPPKVIPIPIPIAVSMDSGYGSMHMMGYNSIPMMGYGGGMMVGGYEMIGGY